MAIKLISPSRVCCAGGCRAFSRLYPDGSVGTSSVSPPRPLGVSWRQAPPPESHSPRPAALPPKPAPISILRPRFPYAPRPFAVFSRVPDWRAAHCNLHSLCPPRRSGLNPEAICIFRACFCLRQGSGDLTGRRPLRPPLRLPPASPPTPPPGTPGLRLGLSPGDPTGAGPGAALGGNGATRNRRARPQPRGRETSWMEWRKIGWR